MRTQEEIEDLHRHNSLLDPTLAVSDLNTFATNPVIFDGCEIVYNSTNIRNFYKIVKSLT